MAKVLFLNPCYYPGFRSGGPQRTVMNIADAFGDKKDIYILTLNRDMGCAESYDVETHREFQRHICMWPFLQLYNKRDSFT